MADARSALPATRDPAVSELARRLRAGALDSAQTARLADAALAAQADRATPWPAAWFAATDDLLAAGALDPPRLKRYLSQAVVYTLQSKPIVRRRRRMPISYGVSWDRLTPSTRLTATQKSLDLRLGGLVVERDFFPARNDTINGCIVPSAAFSLGGSRNIDFFGNELEAMENGPTQLAFAPHVVVALAAPVAAGPFVIDRAVAVPVELSSVSATADDFAIDPAARAAMRAAVSAARVEVERGRATVAVRIDPLPVALAAEVRVEHAGRSVWAGFIRVEANQPAAWHAATSDSVQHYLTQGDNRQSLEDFLAALPGGPAGAVVDVLLRPSQDAADNELQRQTYWGEDLAVRGVTLNAPHAAALNHDESLRPAVEAKLTLGRIEWTDSSGRATISADQKDLTLHVWLEVASPPVKLAYVAGFRFGGKDQPVVPLTNVLKAGTHTSWGLIVDLPGSAPTTFDLILRPSTDWETLSPDLTPPWGGEVTFRDIPIPPRGGPTIAGPFHPAPPAPAPQTRPR